MNIENNNLVNIVALCGSIRKNSINRGLLHAAEETLGDNVSFTLYHIEDLPFYNEDLESDLPESVQEFLAVLKKADAFVISTPEYNMSFSGVLKNALEWGSRPTLGSPMAKKPAAIMGASPLGLATAQAQSQLRQVLFGMQLQVISRPMVMVGQSREKFAQDGTLTDERTKALVQEQMSALVEAVSMIRYTEEKLAR